MRVSELECACCSRAASAPRGKGVVLVQSQPPIGAVPYAPPSRPRASRAWWWIGGAGAVVLLACCLGVPMLLVARVLAPASGAPREVRAPAGPQSLRVTALPVICDAVVADAANGLIYATDYDSLLVLDATGALRGQAPFPRPPGDAGFGGYDTLRLANFDGTGGPELLGFRTWGSSVDALDTGGRLIWRYESDSGIDDAWPGDVDGDGRDEVIVGLNGSSGVPLLDETGAVIWTDRSQGNTWNVCIADANGDGKLEAIAASGSLTVYDASGHVLSRPRVGVLQCRVARPAPPNSGETVLIAGAETLCGLSAKGTQTWRASVGLDLTSSYAIARSRPWLAIGCQRHVVVVDTTNGAIVASQQVASDVTCVTWWDDGRAQPRLYVATRDALLVCDLSAP